MDEYVYEYDFATDIIHFDKKFDAEFNFGGEIKLKTYSKSNPDLNRLLQYMEQAQKKDEVDSQAFQMKNKSGEERWYRLITYVIKNHHGEPKHVIGKIINIQKEREQIELMQNKAARDPLTGVCNREGFFERYRALCARSDENMSIAFTIMDIDDFKSVNDTLGHAGGDVALKLLADTLQSKFGSEGLVARYGGDEFLLCFFGENEESVKEKLADLVETMDTELTYQDATKNISISVGVAYSHKKMESDSMFGKADEALYYVKNNGKNRFYMIQL